MKKETLNRIWNGVFYLAVVMIAAVLATGLFFPNQYSKFFKSKMYVVVSGSMEPVINTYDGIVVSKASVDDLSVGDIITFRYDLNNDGVDEYITHYIAEISEQGIRTKPAVSDEWDRWTLDSSMIVGRVTYQNPKIGKVLIPIYNNAVPILLITNMIVWITILKIVKEDDSSKEKEL
ncbi:signal peptidase I [Erysipelothrix inopinata]|uniref:Signal peptidase I n=1 Tax=Erysipelothrix inopinata TaxID=225084 RepID=A0A7G9RZE1_9FIRM|nr:signal peptidase I [Erysipelothrix inopinata]QNN60966.1 signal peptidase I [Erysipelothrix inopinata]